jgi:hypothetical protein
MRYFYFILIFLSIMIISSCSGKSNPASGGNNPVSDPAILSEIENSLSNVDGQFVLGSFEMIRDPETNDVTIVPYDDREAQGNINVMKYLQKPYCPIEKCWGYELVDFDPANQVYQFDMLLYNPTPVLVYDVRVLFIKLFDTDEDGEGNLYTSNDIVIMNPDGWTKMLDDEETDPEMNPYILFNREMYPTPEYPNPDRDFEPYSFDVERLVMKWPLDYSVEHTNVHGPVYRILASFPDQTEEALQYLWVDQRPPMNPSNQGFSFVSCAIFTHREFGEDENMHVYFSCPDVLGLDGDDNPIEVEMERWFTGPDPGDRVFLAWIARINNVLGVERVGIVPALIRASAPNPDDFDTYWKMDFKIRRNPGDAGHTDYDALMAYTSYETGDAEIFICDNIFMIYRKNITESPDSLEIDPFWARKSEQDWYLYFASDMNIAPWNDPSETDLDIYVQKFRKTGGEIEAIGEPICMTYMSLGDERMPAVAYNLGFVVFAGQDGENGDWEIFRGTLPVVGEPTYFLAIDNLTDNFANERNPTIEPSGNYILFDSDVLGSNSRNIFGMSPTPGSSVSLIFQSSYNDMEPAFNPYNPDYFLFVREGEHESADIWIAQMVGYVVVDIMNLTGDFSDSDERNPCWAPSGEQLMFESDRGQNGDFNLWTMDINGNSKDQQTYDENDDIYANWAPVP